MSHTLGRVLEWGLTQLRWRGSFLLDSDLVDGSWCPLPLACVYLHYLSFSHDENDMDTPIWPNWRRCKWRNNIYWTLWLFRDSIFHLAFAARCMGVHMKHMVEAQWLTSIYLGHNNNNKNPLILSFSKAINPTYDLLSCNLIPTYNTEDEGPFHFGT